MSEGIFHLGEDGSLTELRPQGFINEDDFQELLAKYPRLLPGTSAMEGEERWLLIQREVGIPDESDGSDRWSLDHLFVDREGVPTLVEVKRSTDMRIRREVVGQMLDYAANAIVYWPAERLRAAYESRCEREDIDPAGNLQTFLGTDNEPDNFWNTIKTNLQAGKVRMIFVADVIPKELQRIVEFLNEQMDPAEVLAVELRQYVSGETRSLVPRLVGRTAEAETRKQSPGRKTATNEASLLANVRVKKGDGAARLAEDVLRWARQKSVRVTFGSESFTLKFESTKGSRSIFTCWNGGFDIARDGLAAIEPSTRDSLLSRFASVPGAISDPSRKTPGIRLAETATLNGGSQLLAVLEWFFDSITAAQPNAF